MALGDLTGKVAGTAADRVAAAKAVAANGGKLTGEQENAFEVLQDTLRQYGLEALAADVKNYLLQGYSVERVNIEIQDTEAWKKRFAGNEARRKAGLAVLSPAEYLAVEASYQQVLRQAGLPETFYDSPDDYAGWIGMNISALEVQERAQSAQRLIETSDPNVLSQYRQWYSTGELVAYALDPVRTTTILKRQEAAARLGAAASGQGVTIGQGLAERIAETGLDPEQSRDAFGTVSQAARQGADLAGIYGGSYTADDAAEEVFFADREAGQKRKRLASQERGAFSGSGGASDRALSTTTSGRL